MFETKAQEAPPSHQAELIQALYEVTVNPQIYDRLVDLWGRHLEQCLGAELQGAAPSHADSAAKVSDEISQHLLRAFDILDRLGRSESAACEPASGRAELHLSPSGRILWCSDLAAQTLGAKTQDSVHDLQMSVESQPRLRRMLDRRHCDAEAVFVFFTAAEGHPYPLMVKPAAQDDGKLVLQGMYHQWSAAHDQVLQQMFGLTDAELRLSRELLAGASLRDIAETTGRSVDTLRTQLKSVRRKTYTSTQQQLIRIMTGLETLIREDSNPGVSPPTQDRMHSLPLPDGRQMQYRLFGPAQGLPCLYLHNMLNGANFPPQVLAQLETLNLRLICPYRPGFGGSDADPRALRDPAMAPAGSSADLRALLQHLGHARVVVLGYMSGAVFAFHLAQSFPDLVRGVFNISGAVPLRRLGQIRSMSRRQRVMALTARFAPRVFPTLLRAGIAQIDSGGSKAFLDALFQHGTPDRAVAEQAGHQEILFKGFREVVAQGHQSFAIDSHHVVRDWSGFCQDLRQPVRLVHGAADPVVSLDSVRDFASAQGYDLQVHDNAGQLVLWQEPKAVLHSLRALAMTTLRETSPQIGA